MKRERTDLIVVCDSDSPDDKDLTLRDLEMRDRRRGYFECVYHFIIKRDGEILHGSRPYADVSVGLGGRYNFTSVSICMVGGQTFTRPQKVSLKALFKELQAEYPDALIKNHHEIDRTVADRGLDIVALQESNA